MVIVVRTSDRVVWELARVVMEISWAMSRGETIMLDLKNEGPDIRELGLESVIHSCAQQFDYDLSKLSVIHDCNSLRDTDLAKAYLAPMQFVKSAREHRLASQHKAITKHFGMFVGRSNAPRLELAAYLYNNYQNQTVQTYHYDPAVEFHTNHLGLDSLVHSGKGIDGVARFLQNCPMTLDSVNYPILMDQHYNINSEYPRFFVEIVCESYFSGKTFFVTEKTWRPIRQKTPFIVQGPQWFLKNLQRLGFQTFDSVWSEGYSEDPADHQPGEIRALIDRISQYSIVQLEELYHSLSPILEHNYERLNELTAEDFLRVYEQ